MPKSKRMRLPNGFGQISEIKNSRLRKPFRVMVTVGKSEFGKPVCKLLKPEAYFRTYNEAYQALMKYHENPYDFGGDLTVKAVYERWFERHYSEDKNMSYSSRAQTIRAWSYCSDIQNLSIKELRVRHIKHCMDDGVAVINGKPKTADPTTQRMIKSLFNHIFDYAVEYDLVETNYARNLKISKDVIQTKEVEHEHIPYTDDEINVIWKHEGELIADLILIQCYSGWRPQEILDLRLENINLEEWTFMGGVKTRAGKNRIVPIHPKIRTIVKRLYTSAKNVNSETLVYKYKSGKISSMSYRYMIYHFNAFISMCNLSSEHRPHDGRKHFVTQAKKYNMDEYAIKYIVGHAIKDLTERTYTQRELSWLAEELEKIK